MNGKDAIPMHIDIKYGSLALDFQENEASQGISYLLHVNIHKLDWRGGYTCTASIELTG